MKLFLWIVLLITIVARPSMLLYDNRDVLFSPGYEKRYELLKSLYYSSQYVQKKNPSIIPDDALESFAGGIFLKGLNPILIVHDQPPLGRYLIGLSIFLFDNPSTITIPLLIFSAFGIFLISKLVIQDTLFSMIPVVIFTNEPLFLNKLVYTPLLEPIQLPFIIFSLYFFIKGVMGKEYTLWFLLTSLMLGFVISIRFFILGGGIVASMILLLLSQKAAIKKFVIFLLLLPSSLVILLFSYSRTIIDGYSIFQIFGIQKYILAYHASKFILPFSFWDLLIFNRWHTWWGDRSITSDFQWIIIWPIALILVALYSIMAIGGKVKLNHAEKILFIYLAIISIMLSAGYTSTRYFLPFLPFMYILAVALLKKSILLIGHRNYSKKKKRV